MRLTFACAHNWACVKLTSAGSGLASGGVSELVSSEAEAIDATQIACVHNWACVRLTSAGSGLASGGASELVSSDAEAVDVGGPAASQTRRLGSCTSPANTCQAQSDSRSDQKLYYFHVAQSLAEFLSRTFAIQQPCIFTKRFAPCTVPTRLQALIHTLLVCVVAL